MFLGKQSRQARPAECAHPGTCALGSCISKTASFKLYLPAAFIQPCKPNVENKSLCSCCSCRSSQLKLSPFIFYFVVAPFGLCSPDQVFQYTVTPYLLWSDDMAAEQRCSFVGDPQWQQITCQNIPRLCQPLPRSWYAKGV